MEASENRGRAHMTSKRGPRLWHGLAIKAGVCFRQRERVGAELEAPEEAELHRARQVEGGEELIDRAETAEEARLADAAVRMDRSQRVTQDAVADEVEHSIGAAGRELVYRFGDLPVVDHHLLSAK